jgi:trimeric autotransporter adhesin
MRKIYVVFVLLVSVLSTSAQLVSNYSFSQSNGVYTAITGGTVLGTATANTNAGSLDDVNYSPTFPFTFTFNGTGYTTCNVNTNGNIHFGTATAALYTPISSGNLHTGAISAWGRDLNSFFNIGGRTGEMRWETVGVSPNREIVFQWKDFRPNFSIGTGFVYGQSFQIRLKETSNIINIVYGPGSYAVGATGISNSTANDLQIGLRGATNADYLIRTNTTAQAFGASTAGGTNTTGQNFNTTVATPGMPASGLTYIFTPPPPCVAPTAQPTALSLTPFSTTQINGSFTAASPVPSGYIVVRYPSGAAVTNPVTATTYTAGNTLGLGTVVSVGTGTTFSSTGLTAGTTYDYYVYSYNNTTCSGGPVYLTAAPLTSSATTISCPIPGTYSVGPSGTYSSVSQVVNILSGCILTGAYIFELQPAYISSVETFPITIPQFAGTSATNTVTFRPQTGATNLSITTASTTGTINFNGADNVFFDGRPGGAGTAKEMTIANTDFSATAGMYTIQFINDATANKITYCKILGSSQASVSANILIQGTTGTTGNDDIIIDNNDIGMAGSNPMVNGIFSNGATTSLAIGNSGVSITNNNIYDYYSPAAVNSNGIQTLGSTNFTITGNKLYQTTTKTSTAGATYSGINIYNITAGAGGFNISNNIIGYANASSTGVTTYAGVFANRFVGIQLQGVVSSEIQGNTIAGISFSTNSAATTANGIFTGIFVVAGIANVGNTTANIIGSATGAGSITISATTTGGLVNGLLNTSSSAVNMSGNTVGGITIANTAAIGNLFNGIWSNGTSSTFTCNSNVIGSTSSANSIQLGASAGTTTASCTLKGIYITATTSTNTITSNVVANITNYSINNASTNSIHGMEFGGGTSTITQNTIRDLSYAGLSTSNIGTTLANCGIVMSSSSASQVISQNTIYGLSVTTTAANNVIAAAIVTTGSGTGTISRNRIYGITNSSTGGNGYVAGLWGAGASFAFVNNMINLSNGPIATAMQVAGIFDNGGSGTMTYHYNTIIIAGSQTVSSASVGIQKSAANTVDIKNNIVLMKRTGTGNFYAIANTTGSATGWACDYNVLNSANAATLGVWGAVGAGDRTFATWKTTSGGDANSYNGLGLTFVDETTADLHLNMGTTATPVESGGTVVAATIDYDAQTRPGGGGIANGGGTRPDIGADEADLVSLDVLPPAISYTALTNTCLTTNIILTGVVITDVTGVPLTGANVPRIYYRKNGGSWFSNAGTYTVGTTTNSTWNFTIQNGDMGGVTGADIISYYVIAQDLVGTPNVGSSPSLGLVATGVSAAAITTAPTTPNSYTITLLGGTYTVGVGGNFTTLTAAINAYNVSCLGSAVIFNLTDATYASETFPLTINANATASATNTLTIKPSTGISPSISGTSASAIFVLNAADYVTIDGTNGSTVNAICPATVATRNLTINNTSTSGSSAVVWLQTNVADGVTNNKVINCNIVGNTNTTTLFGIGSGSSLISTSSFGTGNNNNQFINNNISKSQYGISSQGASAANKNTGTFINQNLINTVSPNNVRLGGIVVGFENGVNINANNISGISAATDVFGISLGNHIGSISSAPATVNEVVNATVTKNIISGVTTSSTDAAAGIIQCIIVNPSITTISNNMVSGIASPSTSPDITTGIYLGGGNGTTNVYNNTVLMTAARGTMPGYALAIGGSNPSVNLQNNILVYNSGGSGAGIGYSIALAYTTYTNLTSNNNDFYISGTNTVLAKVGSITGSTANQQATLAAWRTTTGKDANSVNVNPTFTSATDLHLQSVLANATLNNTGINVAAVTDDIDCQTRASVPDMGADEFEALDMGAVTLVSPTAPVCANAAVPVTVTIRNYSNGTIDFSVNPVTVTVNVTGATTATLTHIINTGTLAGLTNLNVLIPTSLNMSTVGTYTFSTSTTVTGDVQASNNTVAAVSNVTTTTLSVAGTVSSNQTICLGTQPADLTLAGNTGTIQWQSSTDNFTYTDISGATSATLTGATIGNLSVVTYFRVVVTNSPCGSVNSAPVTINFTAAPTFANLQFPATGNICQGSSFNTYGKVFQVGVTEAPGANPSITAEFGYSSANNNPNSSGWTWISTTYQGQAFNDDEYTNTFTPATSGTYYYTFRFRQGACEWVYGGYNTGFWNGTTNVNGVLIVSATSAVGVASASQTICSGSTPAAISIASNVGTIQWQSSSDNASFNNIGGANATTLTLGTLTATTYYRCVVTSGVCASVTSNTVTITVDQSPAFANLQFPGTGNICQGASFNSFGQIYQAGVTEAAGASANITAEFGYSSTNNNPNSAGWTWLSTTYNVQSGNNDEYTNTFTSASSGTFYYTFRYRFGTTCPWVYGGFNGGFWNGTTNVNGVLTVSSLPTASIISNNGPICSGSNAVFNLSGTSGAVVTYNVNGGANTTVTLTGGTGVVTINTVAANQTLNLVSITNGTCPVILSGSSVVNISTGGTWTGITNTDWNTASNWSCGGIPTSSTNVTIPASAANYPLINTGTASANNVTVATGATVTVNGTGEFNLSGSITSTGVFDVTNGTLILAANSAVISGLAIKDKSVKDLTISANAAISATANDTLKVTGFVDVNGNSTFNTNNNLTLVSNAAGTASVKDLTNGGPENNVINGQANVERYIETNRKWRFLAINTLGAQTINNSWMEGQTPGTAGVNGRGIWITRGAADPASSNFDAQSPFATMKYWNNNTFAYENVTDPSLFDIKFQPAYMTFVRGDRNSTGTGPGAALTSPTTIRTKGALFQGETLIPIPVSGTGYSALGNPYASAIDLTQLDYNPVATTSLIIAVWDPKLTSGYGLGAFQTLTYGQFGSFFTIFPGGGSYVGTALNQPMNVIESGQGFFVQGVAARTIKFKEKAKTLKLHDVFFTSGIPQFVSARLSIKDPTVNTLVDGVMIDIKNAYSNNVDFDDARKLVNTSENVSVKTNNTLLAIERKALIQDNDSIHLNMTGLRIKDYQWSIDVSNLDEPGRQGFLIDRFLNTKKALDLNAANTVDFAVTSVAGSYAANRFVIVFKQNPIPAVAITLVANREANEQVLAKWSTANEAYTTNYELQRSANGTTFTSIANNAATTNTGTTVLYSKQDAAATKEANYYRVKANLSNGSIVYSNIAKVEAIVKGSYVTVYPNPVKEAVVNVLFANKPTGNCTIQLIDKQGKTVYTTSVNIASIKENKTLKIGTATQAGTYTMVMRFENGDRETAEVVVE